MSTITTTQQADALPTGFVLRLATGRVADRVPNGWTITGIYSPGPVPRGLYDTDLPATVLHNPAGRTEQAIRDDQRAEDLAMHFAFRPEVVAEVAVHLSEESDWEAIAKWCGGTVGSAPDGTDSGEWVGWVALPDDTHAFAGMWIVQRHDLTFAVRHEVAGPSGRATATVTPEALRAVLSLRGVLGEDGIIFGCPWCPDVWESEPTCEHAAAVTAHDRRVQAEVLRHAASRATLGMSAWAMGVGAVLHRFADRIEQGEGL